MAFFTAALSRAPCTASSTTGPCSTRAIARSTASDSTAETIASSVAISTALSIPVARPTAPAPAGPGAQQPRREWRALLGHLPSLVPPGVARGGKVAGDGDVPAAPAVLVAVLGVAVRRL